jgi:hypothetical protein
VVDSPLAGADDRLVHQVRALGAEFAEALAAKDYERIAGLLHPEIDFRGITPRRVWEGSDPEGVFPVEQQAYLAPREGRIGWMRSLCSGSRPPQG